MNHNNNNNRFSNFILKSTRFLKNLNYHWIWLFQGALSLPFLFYKLYSDITRKNKTANYLSLEKTKNNKTILESNTTNYYLNIAFDIKNILFRILDIILNIVGIYVMQPVLLLAIAAKNLLHSCLDMGICLYQRFFSSENFVIRTLHNQLMNGLDKQHSLDKRRLQILTVEVNHQHFLNISLVNNAHRMVIGLITLIGSLFTIAGLTPIGVSILTAVAIYSFIDYLGLNPLRLYVKCCNENINKPFAYINERDMMNQLLSEHPNSHKKIFSLLNVREAKMRGMSEPQKVCRNLSATTKKDCNNLTQLKIKEKGEPVDFKSFHVMQNQF